MKKWPMLLTGLITILILASCSTTTFIIQKDNGKAYYLGRKSKALEQMLCDSGDLKQILAETSIPEDLRDDFYRYNCTAEQSRDKVIAVYTFFTPEERKQLKSAFRRHGYNINYVPC